MAVQIGMFPEPRQVSVLLSGLYDRKEYRKGVAVKVEWRRFKGKKPPTCDECAALQYVTHGGYGPRRQAKHCRTLKRNPQDRVHLYLCDAHMYLWKTRDTNDVKAELEAIRVGSL